MYKNTHNCCKTDLWVFHCFPYIRISAKTNRTVPMILLVGLTWHIDKGLSYKGKDHKLLFKVLNVLRNFRLVTHKVACRIIADSNILFSNPSNHFQNRVHDVSPPLEQIILKQHPL